ITGRRTRVELRKCASVPCVGGSVFIPINGEGIIVNPLSNNGTAFVVRRATSADADKMLFVWQETADMLSRSDGRYHLAPDAGACWRSALLEWLQRDDIAIFVAESLIKEGHILGYIVGSIVADLPILIPERHGYVSDLAVDSHGKVGGIGRAMLDALKGWFHERNVSHIQARVPSRHPIAQAFWRAQGASELYDQMWLKLE
ncbi:MAG: GNAT family N-acetyltransferase, partial [Chloroflexota bacterium]